MANLQPVDLKARSTSARTSRKIVIGLLGGLIVSVMIVWVGFLGWGVVEALKKIAAFVVSLWTSVS